MGNRFEEAEQELDLGCVQFKRSCCQPRGESREKGEHMSLLSENRTGQYTQVWQLSACRWFLEQWD